jgi:hypothetical protein
MDAARDSTLYSERLEHIVATRTLEDGSFQVELDTP